MRAGRAHRQPGVRWFAPHLLTALSRCSCRYPSNRQIKVSTFLYDVPIDGGALTLVPGSHRMPNAPQQTLERSFCGGRGHYHKPQSPTRPATIPQGYNDDGSPAWIGEPGRDLPSVAMPNCVQCAVQAGSAVAFDISCWHVAVPNLSSSSDRVGTIVGYGSDGGGMQLAPEHIDALEAAGRMTPLRKRSFGLEMTAQEQAELAAMDDAAQAWIHRRTGGHSN